ncbi:hypothetical protein BJ875DRAFT_450238 [Amylocarpus encephaloides]|uniref:Uncharacterized protein n=1 Tax=Amylocarpus encephaloides TaxID=45428 RepID=A0A9P7YS54_9HELO|nr:hypothetical protein BJ875DRAFT_450238 [Amylocarpus encephaloides]
MSNAITKFCSEAARQGVQDSNSGSIARRYNPDTGEEVGLNMDWAPGLPFSLVESECVAHMSLVMNNCDGNNPQNPMNWKHGGALQVGPVRYAIHVAAKRYFAGTCSLGLRQFENGLSPTLPTKYTFKLRLEARDAKGRDVGGTGGEEAPAGDQHPYRLAGVYYDDLVITPEAAFRSYDYVQFSLGGQSWRQDDAGVTPGCSSGEYEKTGDSNWERDIVCTFHC